MTTVVYGQVTQTRHLIVVVAVLLLVLYLHLQILRKRIQIRVLVASYHDKSGQQPYHANFVLLAIY